MNIGFRIPGKAKETPFPELCSWAKGEGFGSIDLYTPDAEQISVAREAGLEIGTVDLSLASTLAMLSSDAEKRREGVEAAKQTISAAAELGCHRMFCVFFPEDRTQKRAESFAYWKEAFPEVVSHAEALDVRIAMEGWPGPAPHLPALGCTPEMWRAMFAAVPSPAFGLNYDPSHLVRLGIDWLRALDEFGDRVIHVHGKDTDFDAERAYEHGRTAPTFRQSPAFGEGWWRYTIPGDGAVDWRRLIARLEDLGYNGPVSVELEDYRYHETWPLQQEGLVRSLQHLRQWVR